MWRVLTVVGAILFGAAITIWEFNSGPEPPYDSWTISDEMALDVAEATLRYQIENQITGRKAKKAQWFVMVYRDIPSDEFAARFPNYPQIIKSYSELDADRDTVLFQIKSAQRVDDQTIVVMGKVSGGDDSGEKPLIGLTMDEDFSLYRVEFRGNLWEVTESSSS